MDTTQTIVHHHTFSFSESWMAKNWRPLAAIVYLLICLCDFIFMPVYYEWANNRYTSNNIVELSLKYSAPIQIDVLKTLRAERVWQPITLSQNAMFHIVFGAILGVSAWARGTDKQAQYMAAMNATTVSK
jgi:hypothetical protein